MDNYLLTLSQKLVDTLPVKVVTFLMLLLILAIIAGVVGNHTLPAHEPYKIVDFTLIGAKFVIGTAFIIIYHKIEKIRLRVGNFATLGSYSIMYFVRVLALASVLVLAFFATYYAYHNLTLRVGTLPEFIHNVLFTLFWYTASTTPPTTPNKRKRSKDEATLKRLLNNLLPKPLGASNET